jgi:phage-related protein
MMAQEDKLVIQTGMELQKVASDTKEATLAIKSMTGSVKQLGSVSKSTLKSVNNSFGGLTSSVKTFESSAVGGLKEQLLYLYNLKKSYAELKLVFGKGGQASSGGGNGSQLGSALGGIGKSAASGLSKIFLNLPDLLSASLTTIDFSSLGGPFSSALGSMLGSIDLTTFTQGMAQKMVAAGTNIAPAMTQVGLGLAASFNQMLATLDFSALGTVLAQRLMALPLQLSAIVTALDWSALGLGIAAVLTTLLTSIDLSMIATTIANFLNGIATTIMTFVTTFDWAGLAANVFNGINSLFTGIDWGLLAATISQTAMTLLQTMIDIVMGIDWGSIGLAIWQFIANIDWLGLIGNLLNLAFELLKGAGETIKGLLGGIFSSVASFFSGIWNNITQIFGNVANWFKDKFSQAWEAVKNVFSAGGRVFDGIKDGILNGLKNVINALIKGINRVIQIPFDGINTALRGIKGIEILGLRPFGWISTIKTPQIPYLATGAVIPPNAPFLAVLGDQRRGNNIEAPEGLIRKIVREEAGQGGARGGSYRFTAQINRRTLFEEFINEAKLRQMTTGRNPFELA